MEDLAGLDPAKHRSLQCRIRQSILTVCRHVAGSQRWGLNQHQEGTIARFSAKCRIAGAVLLRAIRFLELVSCVINSE